MTIKNLKYTFRALALASTITLSGCGMAQENETSAQIENHTYSANDYMVVFMDGEVYLCKVSTLDYFLAQFGGMNFTDVSTDEVIAQFSTSYDNKGKKMKVDYSNQKGSYISRWAATPLADIISSNTISDTTIDYFHEQKEEVKDFLDRTIEYPTEENFVYRDETYVVPLNLYTFYSEAEDKTTYHIGYKASIVSECDTIYDIMQHKIYKMPEIGEVKKQHINEFYDGDMITAEQAQKVLEEYITDHEYSKKKPIVKHK